MAKDYHLGLVGAGQMGSRHLQALALIDRPVSIQVVDPSPASLKCAEERFNEVHGSGKVKAVRFFDSIAEMSPDLDCVIVATKADVRREVVETLLEQKSVRYLILEKVLFQKIPDFQPVHTLLDRHRVRAWVNFPRRIWPIYQALRAKLANGSLINFNASGSQWGLACNGLHFLDLFAFLANRANITVLHDQLSAETTAAARPGFLEFTGTLYGSSAGKDQFVITSYPEGAAPMLVHITSPTVRFLVDEGEKLAWHSEESDKWKWDEEPFQIPYQSQLTHLVVQELLDTGQCGLTSYEDAWRIHVPFLEALLSHLKKNSVLKDNACPIT